MTTTSTTYSRVQAPERWHQKIHDTVHFHPPRVRLEMPLQRPRVDLRPPVVVDDKVARDSAMISNDEYSNK